MKHVRYRGDQVLLAIFPSTRAAQQALLQTRVKEEERRYDLEGWRPLDEDHRAGEEQ